RQICQIRSMPFSRVYDLQTSRSPSCKQFPIWIYSAAQLGDIVSQHFAKSAGLKKVSLHVNDKKCAPPRIEFERIGFGVNAQSPIHLHGVDPCGGRELKTSIGRRALHMPVCVAYAK